MYNNVVYVCKNVYHVLCVFFIAFSNKLIELIETREAYFAIVSFTRFDIL